MSIKVLDTNGKRAHDAAGELVDSIIALVYGHADDKMPVATAIGAIEIAKLQILKDQEGGE